MTTKTCKFVSKNNLRCTEHDIGNGYCFWHDPQADKANLNLADKLENHIRRGGFSIGLKLKRANLQGINLVNRGNKGGFDLSESDLYRANLKGAHLFNLKLNHGSLMKADLREANLHCADLSDSNLLGVKLHEAKLDNIDIGVSLAQEKAGQQFQASNDAEQAMDNFEQAEEIYRQFRRCAEDQGLHTLAGKYSYRERVMHRKQLPKWTTKWLFSHLMDLLCGYGEKPENTITFSIILIFTCALGYFFFGVNYYENQLKFSADAGLGTNIATFFMALYYSVVTFTTLGYGDITPFGVTRFIAVIEAFLGSFTIALFVVVFVKRMSR